jgi:hypothetical protein
LRGFLCPQYRSQRCLRQRVIGFSIIYLWQAHMACLFANKGATT